MTRGLLYAAFASAIIATLKLLAFFWTGSLLVLASGLDSLVDTAMSLANKKFHDRSLLRADREHPYGHGGIEIVAALLQAILVGASGLFIGGESLLRFYRGTHASEVHEEGFAFAFVILAVSSLAAYGIQAFLRGVSRRKVQGVSLVLEADRAHYSADALANLIATLALTMVWLTGYTALDAAFGLLGAFFLLRTAWPVLRLAIDQILQHELPTDVQQRVVDLAHSADARVKGIHRLRTRAAGPTHYFDFHLQLSRHLRLGEAHAVGEIVASAIKKVFPGADVIIHLDPDDEPKDDLWEPAYEPPS